jgi:4-alpha-glucanotransferase
MNTPSVASGNWRWRMTRAQWKGAPGLREMAELYGRVT